MFSVHVSLRSLPSSVATFALVCFIYIALYELYKFALYIAVCGLWTSMSVCVFPYIHSL